MTGMKGKHNTSALFTPIRISGLTIRNRIIMPAMILNYPVDGYAIGDAWTRFYAERSTGGAGLIIAGACHVSQSGKMDPHQVGADCDEWLPALEKIARSIKAGGAAAALQLNHAGRYSKRAITGTEVLAPSAIASRYTKELPKEMSTGEVEAIVTAFAAAAYRAKQAGFDAVELLGATGYLISQFLSPLTNHRHDRYGGSEIGRRNFAKEVVGEIKTAVGDDFPLIFRQSSTDNIPGGMDATDQQNFSQALKAWGVHLLNITAGWHDAPVHQIGPSVPQGYFIPLATRIRAAVEFPVACAMRITEPAVARRAIDENQLDMVTMARALIADPEWPKKTQAGEDASIRKCICCCNCFDQAFSKKQIECSVNPVLGGETLKPAKRCRRILVVGGGPAGMEAACILARRGHRVTILEKEKQLGGRLLIGSKPPYKSEITNLVRFLTHELQSFGVSIERRVDFDTLADQFDGVILAAGAQEKNIAIKGMENIPTYPACQVMEDLALLRNPVIIVGAGLVGCETAEYLHAKQYTVNIVEIQARPLPDMGMSLRWPLLQRLKEAGITIHTESFIKEIIDNEAIIKNGAETRVEKVGSLIIAVGFTTKNGLRGKIESTGLPCCVIGDQKAPRRIKDAIAEGHMAATAWMDEWE
ncbi:FAD-dependent oxidoreductase [uncultured Desulfosarcina sp.]|uniref:oxidoreductase n=1 Tax=uncultured Desulfosarcina sp. TaxID=218289 RepID=UPI0029C74C46|nr:FAD-dependent oxidoreductase [uncultured Desulfosarcina sp.]